MECMKILELASNEHRKQLSFSSALSIFFTGRLTLEIIRKYKMEKKRLVIPKQSFDFVTIFINSLLQQIQLKFTRANCQVPIEFWQVPAFIFMHKLRLCVKGKTRFTNMDECLTANCEE